jgi:hypothetical protein
VIRNVQPLGDPCWTDDMKPAYLGSSALAGSILAYFSLTNTESATCHTYGYPKIEFLSSAGGVLLAQIGHSKKTSFDTPTPATMVNLAPGQKAYFKIVSTSTGPSGRSCAKATEMELTVPYDSLAQTVPVPGGVPACGAVTVSPVLPHYIAYASN